MRNVIQMIPHRKGIAFPYKKILAAFVSIYPEYYITELSADSNLRCVFSRAHLGPLRTWMAKVLPHLDDSEPLHGDMDTVLYLTDVHMVSYAILSTHCSSHSHCFC